MMKKYDMEKIKDRDYELLSRLIYDVVGINIGQSKRELLRARTSKRLRALGITTFREYYKYVTEVDIKELSNLCDVISTNKTSFFREEKHFEYLNKVLLPEISKGLNPNGGNILRVWSAACSTGNEPYSLAITLSEFFEGYSGLTTKILGTDISTDVIEKAKEGVYKYKDIKDVPPLFRQKYFLRSKSKTEDTVKVKKVIRDMVRIRRLNLISERFPFTHKFDFVFLRNVMIYFDRHTQEAVANKIYNYLKPGGYLFLGHAESLMGADTPFTYVKPTVYLKEK